jgi:hypothetical protein
MAVLFSRRWKSGICNFAFFFDLCEAIRALRKNGFKEPFQVVKIVRPVVFPAPMEAYYTFTCGETYVFIGAETLKYWGFQQENISEQPPK